MNKYFNFFFLVCFLLGAFNISYAATINILVTSDAHLNNMSEDDNFGYSPALWVRGGGSGPHQIEGMVGIDVQDFTSLIDSIGPDEELLLNSIKFYAHNQYIFENTGDVHIALGNNDNWDENTVTWNTSNGDYGESLDSVTFILPPGDSWSRPNVWTSWDVSEINISEMDDDYLTFYLYSQIPTATVTRFESSESGQGNLPYLEFDYTINPTSVPDTSVMLLLAPSLIGLVGFGRRLKR